MALEFFKKRREEMERKKEQQKTPALKKWAGQPVKTVKPRVIEEEDELVVDEAEPEEEFEENEVETPEVEEVEEQQTKGPKTIVVKELPVQPISLVKDPKGQQIKLITIEEALTKILQRLEED
jgi:hypothetical protein